MIDDSAIDIYFREREKVHIYLSEQAKIHDARNRKIVKNILLWFTFVVVILVVAGYFLQQ